VDRGKRAVTEYEVTEVYEDAALLSVTLHTGRTHQIRVHLADLGHGLIGDTVYGARQRSRHVLGRPALHAHRLAFEHPFTKARIELEAPIPADLSALLESLTARTERS
jgi:23S rRNA pseudouridine1911/1915/1917 synthase